MKRTPIIAVGQVYLHPGHNEYLVVTKSNRGDIGFKGPGFYGLHELDTFLERFGPVDPEDLTREEYAVLQELVDGKELTVGWVEPDDDDEEEGEDDN